MQDEDLELVNLCADLVSRKQFEGFPLHLFRSRRAGEWVQVQPFCQEAGVATVRVKPELVATWLPDPFANNDYAVILFYDDETGWSSTAHYNIRRLLANAPEP